ncbi:S41 family peptidase [Rickettsiales bacterium]|nr:S41 family peptidase [Rickettsiales bacterium]
MQRLSIRIFFSLAVLLLVNASYAQAGSNKETLRLLDLFGDVFDKVKRDYVEDVEDKDLIESAINGMLSSLDPHSSYLNEKAFEEMRIQTRGEFGGLGIEVTMENGLVKVVSPIDDTPAYRAGIKAGDYISRIDGEAVMGTTLSESVEKMRGKPGTNINLDVLREGESEPLKIEITRAIIKIKSVRSRQEEDVIYIRVTSFSENTADNIEREIKKLLKKIGEKEFKGVVLDLRNNPGGLLDQAIEVSDLFLEQGEIVSTGGKVEDSNKRFNASKGDIIDKKPIVVLINGGSASASEIVAGALQDHRRAVIMGEKSFGKGSVQTIIPLSASKGAMRLTTSRYFTPSGRSIQAEGIEPDVVVTQSKIEAMDSKGRASEATLRKHLKNNDGKNSKGDDKDDKVTRLEKQKELYEKDYQLGRAIDLLRVINIIGADMAFVSQVR